MIWIGCELHIINIIFVNFENEAFGHVAESSKKPHSFNFLYLTWYLYDGYRNKNNNILMNIKLEYIQTLYKSLLGFYYSQYQMSL